MSPEFFSWGYHGGFGFVTRTLGREMARRGHEVSVVTPRRPGQGAVEELDGVTVYGFPSRWEGPRPLGAFLSRLGSMGLYRRADAEIYHSEAVSYNTLAAITAMRDRFHIITFQDPYDLGEWRRISLVEGRYRLTPAFRARCSAEALLLSSACHRADGLYAQAQFLIDRARRLFRLRSSPGFLPNPVEVPQRGMRKAPEPMVCFLARWDPQKRVEVFFELAKRFPDVEFIAMGKSRDRATDSRLRRVYGGVPNLRLAGFVSEEEKSRILEGSWALLNTSVREALPVSFLEALAHETPIISGEDPDGLTSAYGYPVRGDDYASALEELLRSEDWREKGRRGRELVGKVYEVERVVDRHIEVYRGFLEGRR